MNSELDIRPEKSNYARIMASENSVKFEATISLFPEDEDYEIFSLTFAVSGNKQWCASSSITMTREQIAELGNKINEMSTTLFEMEHGE